MIIRKLRPPAPARNGTSCHRDGQNEDTRATGAPAQTNDPGPLGQGAGRIIRAENAPDITVIAMAMTIGECRPRRQLKRPCAPGSAAEAATNATRMPLPAYRVETFAPGRKNRGRRLVVS
jgi:hypothetical protein